VRPNQETTATWEDPVEQVDRIQQQAARSAENVGAFGSRFKADLHQMLLDEAKGDDGAETAVDLELRVVAEEREGIVEKATQKNRDMTLRNLGDSSRLGQAMVGEDGTEELNEDRFANLRTHSEIDQMDHAGRHEFAHTTQVYVSLLANEGHAEIKANMDTGKSPEAHREGQPASVYGEGQDLMLKASREFTWNRVDAMMTGKEDRGKLLTWLAEVDPELGGQGTANPEYN
jgi:hypothetical protein|tara:strand:- start:144 stop:836 length:693 start_codon:yes stop_codon:yes gene_type:complete